MSDLGFEPLYLLAYGDFSLSNSITFDVIALKKLNFDCLGDFCRPSFGIRNINSQFKAFFSSQTAVEITDHYFRVVLL